MSMDVFPVPFPPTTRILSSPTGCFLASASSALWRSRFLFSPSRLGSCHFSMALMYRASSSVKITEPMMEKLENRKDKMMTWRARWPGNWGRDPGT